VRENPRAGLSYGRLSIHGGRLLEEAGLHVYERVDPQPEVMPPMVEEGWMELKREVFRTSERGEAGKRARWLIEKRVAPSAEPEVTTRNSAMHPDIHLLWPEDPGKRDILQEYFVPEGALQPFLAALARAVRDHGQNLLNVTVRAVRRDDDTLLAYARADSFAVVLFFSQEATPEGEESMRAMTSQLIDRARELQGSFYLPYRLHYSREQFLAAYPGAGRFLDLKAARDPGSLFSSWFYRHICGIELRYGAGPSSQTLPTQ
jgi:FAD/FMN-containing dehydrogenase